MSFKKRQAPGNLRSKAQRDEEEEEESTLSTLEDVKLEQAFRKRRAGVPSLILINEAKPKEQEHTQTDAPAATKDIEIKFTHTLSSTQEAVSHTKIMEQYVNEQLGVNKPEDKQKVLTEEDKLYLLPPTLKTDHFSEKVDEDVGALVWNTGIAEVALPIEFKLKNIEDTAAAKKKLQAAKTSDEKNQVHGIDSALGNLTTNYALHRREWARDQRDRHSSTHHTTPQIPAVPTSSQTLRDEPHKRTEHSTDDVAVERFKKKQRRF